MIGESICQWWFCELDSSGELGGSGENTVVFWLLVNRSAEEVF